MQQEQTQHSKSLWEILGLNLLENTEQQLITRRVVVVGDALSGKRTFTSRLFAAAMQQFPSASISASTQQSCNANGVSPSGNSGSLPLSPSAAGMSDAAGGGVMGAEGHVPARSFPQFLHGSGITQAYIMQRIPASSRSAFLSLTEENLGGVGSSLYNNSSSSRSSNIGGWSGITGTSGGRRVMTEFFCCEAPGALSMALPTVEALETSVVLVVVDTSEPGRLRDQLRRWYGYLNTHVMETLRVELPKQDEVRRMRMIEQQQRFWQAQQQSLASVRRRWCEREAVVQAGASSCGGSDKSTSLPVLQVPKGNVSPLRTILVCTKTDQLEKFSREVEKLSYKTFPSSADASHIMSGDNNNNTISVPGWVSSNLLASLRTTGLTLLEFVGQLLRKEAIAHQSALVAAGSRVNTVATSSLSQHGTSAASLSTSPSSSPAPAKSPQQPSSLSPGGGGLAGPPFLGSERLSDEAGPPGPTSLAGSPNIFVHPFYKSLWAYIFQLLYEQPTLLGSTALVGTDPLITHEPDEGSCDGGGVAGAADGSVASAAAEVSCTQRAGERGVSMATLLDETETQVSSRFHPHAFLPHGVDYLELLSPFITSTDPVTLESGFTNTTTGTTCGVEKMREKERGSLRMHNEYMQQIEKALATAGPDEEAMIWDRL